MSVDTNGGHPAMDYAQHKTTYASFVRGVTVTIVLLVLLLVGMAAFLT